MFNMRRIPGLLINYRYVTITCIVISLVAVYYLLQWGFMCTNFQTWHHVSKLCQLHRRGEAVGSLCKPLCDDKTVHSLSCHPFSAAKGAVFSAEFQGSRLVFKAARALQGTPGDPAHAWLETLGEQRYPTEAEFEAMIRDTVAARLNLTISREQTGRLARLGFARAKERSMLRGVEMHNLWLLLQDNEYVCSSLYADRDVFPQVVGTCGPFFAVEHLDPLRPQSGVLSGPPDTPDEWASRVKMAVLVLDLLDELESNLPQPFHLCDVKLSHFGLSAGRQRVKYLDLASVLPRPVVDRATAAGQSCDRHRDCDLADCRSTCNHESGRCDRPVANDNYQVVCEKVFLGWAMSARVIVPGLLMSRHTPSSLAALLRQCANPDTDSDMPRARPGEDLRRRLYATLSEMDLHLTNELYI